MKDILYNSHYLRNLACNGFLMGITTGISDLKIEYKLLANDYIQPLWKLIEQIGYAEEEKNVEELYKLWQDFWVNLNKLRPFLKADSPINSNWVKIIKESFIDLKSQIIICDLRCVN